MLLTLLRHGVTESNKTGRFNGMLDEGLTEAQKRKLKEINFDASRFDAIYCSPLLRAVETASCLGIVDWKPEERLVERHLGIFQGLTSDECRAQHPREFAAFQKFDADYEIPEGESRAQNHKRVLDWLSETTAHRHVLAITHGGTVDLIYRLASELPLHGGDEIYASENASLSSFEVSWPDVRMLEYSRSF